MIEKVFWVFAVLLISFVAYILSYARFRRMIAIQTKQMIALMKAEDIDNLQIGNIFSEVDADF